MRAFKVEKFHGFLNAYHMGMVAQMSSFALRNQLQNEGGAYPIWETIRNQQNKSN